MSPFYSYLKDPACEIMQLRLKSYNQGVVKTLEIYFTYVSNLILWVIAFLYSQSEVVRRVICCLRDKKQVVNESELLLIGMNVEAGKE